MSSNVLGDDVMGHISHRNVLSLWMLGFWPYHAKWGEVLSNVLWILHLLTSADVYAVQHHLFACWLMSRRPDLAILCMLLLWLSFFSLIQDASQPVFSMDILNDSTSKLVTSVELTKGPFSSNLISLYGCFHYSVLWGWSRWFGQGFVWMR